MAPFSIPTPSIIPLRLPVYVGPKSIDTNTKIQIHCETYLEHEIFYTIDGTKPQPYAGIVQGNKTIKYISPFCLPAGKITIKAMAINAVVHTMCSSVVTKCFDVLKIVSEDNESSKAKQSGHIKSRKNSIECESKRNATEKINKKEENLPETCDKRMERDAIQESVTPTNCLEEAFIGSSDFEIESHDDDIEDKIFQASKNTLDINDNFELTETRQYHTESSSDENDSVSEVTEKLTFETDKGMTGNPALTDSGASIGTQFCCLKCDLTLQQCISCNKMNAVSSKFCIGCGEQLLQICHFCKEWNPTTATFCQYCGKKIGSRMEPYLRLDQLDQSVMTKPELKNFAVQVLPTMTDKCTQTGHDRNSGKRSSLSSNRLPPMSPGRGYWHQQLDYICNHLKSHAYNNVDFRNEISKPSLCDFKAAHIIREENNIVISLSFTPFVPASREMESEDKNQGRS